MNSAERSARSVSITIDLAAIRHNLSIARQLSGGGKLFAVIKADAYGHGAIEVMRGLSRPDVAPANRADGFAVVTVGEAVALREAGSKLPILVLQGPQQAGECAELLSYDLWPVIHDQAQLSWYRQCSERDDLAAWLKVDTGMGRLGVTPAQAAELLQPASGIQWRGVLSHLACADEPGNDHTDAQIAAFDALPLPVGVWRSLANSAAILAWPATKNDWARPGLMLYGVNPLNREAPDTFDLKQAMRVKAPLVSVKTLLAGSGVGYAQTWTCPETMSVGLLGIGYGDGLPRVLDSSARVIVHNVACPVIGRVSMDSIAVDLRAVPAAAVGDMAQLWGPEQSVDALAAAAGTISYELLTGIRGSRMWQDYNFGSGTELQG
ncbi:MAG: alanine racemase [Granulosicoccus sp.]